MVDVSEDVDVDVDVNMKVGCGCLVVKFDVNKAGVTGDGNGLDEGGVEVNVKVDLGAELGR